MESPLYLTLKEKLLLDNLLNGICMIDESKTIVYWNAAAEQILGYSPDQILNKDCYDEIFVQDLDSLLCKGHCPLNIRENFAPLTTKTSLKHKDGRCLPMQVRCIPLLNRDGETAGAIMIFGIANVSEDINLKLKELEQFAYLDALTSIPNRRYMLEILQDWLKPDNRRNLNCAVVMGDIDFFKDVNDKHGHDAGDAVLVKVAETLRKNLRTTDVVGRWGGEEFLIILQNIDRKQLLPKLESLRKSIELCEIENGGASIKVTMSFGCAMPRRGETMDQVLALADKFLYKSKHEGRNQVNIADNEARVPGQKISGYE